MPTLNIDGTEFTLSIKQYAKPEISDTYRWSEIELGIKNKHINYELSSELLMQEEVFMLIDSLQALIEDGVKKEFTLRFAEPDLEIEITPKEVGYSRPGEIVYRIGHGTYDSSITIIVHFWHKGCLIGETYHIPLCFNEVVDLLAGLEAEKEGLPLPNESEKAYLIGVSKIETPEELIWCWADGFDWDDCRYYWIEDEQTKRELIVLEEVRRAYYKNNLPIPLNEIKTIKRRATTEEKERADRAWDKYFDEHIQNELYSNKKSV